MGMTEVMETDAQQPRAARESRATNEGKRCKFFIATVMKETNENERNLGRAIHLLVG